MPEHLKALVYVLALAGAVFALAKGSACAAATTLKDFERRRNIWLLLTLVAFLAHNFWIFILVSTVVLLAAGRAEQNKLALFFLLLFALPRISVEIPGFGVVNALFAIDWVRLLALTLLLPAYLSTRRQPAIVPFGRILPDWFVGIYLILDVLMMLKQTTLANVMRDGLFYNFIDVFLPYYVASRSVRRLQEFRDALMAFAVAGLVLSATLATEFGLNWLLYTALEDALGTPWGWNYYLLRDGHLRASGPAGYSIAAGFIVASAITLFLYLRVLVPGSTRWRLGMALLGAGLVAPLSRGPWVGCAAALVVFIATGPAPALRFAQLALLSLIGLPLLVATPGGGALLDYLPFVGSIEAETVTGRQLLLRASLEVLLENPLLGARDYADNPTMQALAAANHGYLDLVNTYVVTGLSKGFIGLSLFVGFFLVVGVAVVRGLRRLSDQTDERYLLGRTLLAALVGILVTIGTCSPVLVIPFVYWTVAGLGIAYAGMLAAEAGREAAQPAMPRSVVERHRRAAAPVPR